MPKGVPANFISGGYMEPQKRGMKAKTIKAIIKSKINHWLETKDVTYE